MPKLLLGLIAAGSLLAQQGPVTSSVYGPRTRDQINKALAAAGTGIVLPVGSVVTGPSFSLPATGTVTSAYSCDGSRTIVTCPPYNADPTGLTDSGPAFRAAVAAGIVIYVPPGNYAYSPASASSGTVGIDIGRNRVRLACAGKKVATLTFVPTAANQIGVRVWNQDGSVNYQSSITDCGMAKVGTAQVATAIKLIDVSEFELAHISIQPWADDTHASKGLVTQGREATSPNDLQISADIPVSVEKNPNDVGEDMDHWHWHDIYLIPHSSQPNIKIADGLQLSNDTWDGYQAWVGGTHGVYWVDTTATIASTNLTFKNVRWENGVDQPSGWMFYFSRGGGSQFIQNLNISDMYGTPNGNGVYVRNAQNVAISNFFYTGTHVGLNLDSNTVSRATVSNYYNPFGTDALASTLTLTCLANGGINTCGSTNTLQFSKSQVNGDSTAYPTTDVYGQLEIAGATTPAKRLSMGYNTSTSTGYIQALYNANSFNPLALNHSGGIVIVGLDGMQLAGGTQPTCDVTTRGLFQMVGAAHSAGVKDVIQVCAADGSNVYAWRTIY